MDMFRVTARWTGFSGAPGYSNFYFSSGFFDGGLLNDEAELLADRVRRAFTQIGGLLPAGSQVQVMPEVPVIDSDTGVIQSFTSIDQPDAVEAGTSSSFAGPAGAVVTWRTDDVRNGRRIRGRTFIVPIGTQHYENDGTLTSAAINNLRGFADRLMGDTGEGDLGVWSRPVGGSGGVFATVTSYSIPDMVAVLRSRRD